MGSQWDQELNARCQVMQVDAFSGNGVNDGEVVCLPNSSLADVSDDEISTKKEWHRRLGPVDLNETVLYDFPEFDTAIEGESKKILR